MRILEYSELDTSGLLAGRYQKLLSFLKQDDFNSADVKKLRGTPYYRAKLDDTNRVLFQFLSYQDTTYLLILEIIRNHDYANSRFLNKHAKVDEDKIDFSAAQDISDNPASVHYLHPDRSRIHFLDRFLSFDDRQDLIYQQPLPIILIGSAGSGKTVLTLEKMKTLEGSILYVTHSAYLVENTERLYYAHQYSNNKQELAFYTFWNLLESIRIPQGKEIDLKTFAQWFMRQTRSKALKDPNKAYEEIRGVITGSSYTQAYLSKEDYLNLGIKQSIFLPEDREALYELFTRYLSFLKESKRFDSNILSYEYLDLAKPIYDYIVIDEVQDFTNAQLYLVLHLLNDSKHLMLCGDANQIVHPNFFSWSQLKSLFYQSQQDIDITFFLTKNYRNTPEVTRLANNLLRLKNLRFGSIDKESHYLVESHTARHGEVLCLEHVPNVLKELNEKTSQSTQFAVIVLDEESKALARQQFKTPLIFSVQEAKGLEYDNIILYNFISSKSEVYREISRDVGTIDEHTVFEYHRGKDKTDKSLEVYKFYVNALYVGMTRAIASIYWVESEITHSLIRALKMDHFQNDLTLAKQESSLEDWQKEAQKLERQGKDEQVEAIKQNILQHEKPKWAVLTRSDYRVLKEKFLHHSASKDEKLTLLEYGLVYDHKKLLRQLIDSGFKPALRLPRAQEFLDEKYFTFYRSSNSMGVLREVTRFGVDFRNPFNQTPLFVATCVGNEKLATELIARGANVHLTDNYQRNAFRLLLANVYFGKKNAVNLVSKLYHGLNTGNISLQVDNRLIKLNSHLMEFFLLNLLLAILPVISSEEIHALCFGVDMFLKQIQFFPESIVPAYRKKRAYLSSILSKNEMYRDNPYNRKLFFRYKQGYYLINPTLQIRSTDQEDWISIYTFMGLPVPSIAS